MSETIGTMPIVAAGLNDLTANEGRNPAIRRQVTGLRLDCGYASRSPKTYLGSDHVGAFLSVGLLRRIGLG